MIEQKVSNGYNMQPVAKPCRAVSLVPAATEIVYFLDAIDKLVGVTEECTWPFEVRKLPKVVKPILNTNYMTSLEVEEEVQKLLKIRGELYTIDIELLASLKPDVIITQDLCKVCSISPDSFIKKLNSISKNCKVISLNPKNVFDIIESVEKVAEVLNIKEKGRMVANNLYTRYINIIECAKKEKNKGKKCLFIEWLNPIYTGGYWTTQILDDLNTIPIVENSGLPAKKIPPQQILDFNPDYIIISPCGRKGDILIKEMKAFITKKFITQTTAYKNNQIHLVPECFTTKPGPRIIDGVKILYEILYKNNINYRFTLD